MKTALVNHLVCQSHDGRRKAQAKRLGNGKVERQFIFCGSLHGQVAWLLAAKDAIEIGSGLSYDGIEHVGVGDQCTAGRGTEYGI